MKSVIFAPAFLAVLIAGCSGVAETTETRVASQAEWDYVIIKGHTYIQHGGGYGYSLFHDPDCVMCSHSTEVSSINSKDGTLLITASQNQRELLSNWGYSVKNGHRFLVHISKDGESVHDPDCPNVEHR